MRRALVVLPAVVLLLAVSPAFSTPTLDQHQDGANDSVRVAPGRGQTFTAGLSGLLDHIEVHGWDGFVNASPMTVEIRDTTIGGMPGPTTLGSVDVATGFPFPPAAWISIDFLSQNIPMSAGSMYSIVLSNDPNPFANFADTAFWVPGVDPDPYAAGRLWYPDGSGSWAYLWNQSTGEQADMQFRTYVETSPTIPAPGAMVLAGIGATLVGWLRRRRAV